MNEGYITQRIHMHHDITGKSVGRCSGTGNGGVK